MQPASGRLLIFLEPGSGAKSVEVNEFHPSATSIAAKEISDLKPGSSIDIDVDSLAFPAPFSVAEAGNVSGAGGSRCGPHLRLRRR